MSPKTTCSTETADGPPDYRKITREALDEFSRRKWILWRRLDKQRLKAEIVQVRARYADLKGRERLEAVRDRLVADTAQSLVRGDIDNGWKFLQALEREMVLALDPMELEARFVSAKSEAKKKLGCSWRGKATQRLVQRYEKIGEVSSADATETSGQSEPRSTSAEEGSAEQGAVPDSDDVMTRRQRILQEIVFHLHSEHQNTYHKLGKLRGQLRLVGTGVVVTLVLIVVLNACGFFAPLGSDVERTLWLALVSGLVGGVLSVASSVVRTDPSRKIPEMSQSFVVTSIRPFVGAAIALPLFFFIESGLLTVGGPTNKRWILLAFCFIGGFSERWFLGIVEGLGRRARTGAESQTES